MIDNKIQLMYNPQAEVEVICALMADDNIFPIVQDKLSEDLFTDPDCRRAYRVMVGIVADGKLFDATEFAVRLMSAGGNASKFISMQYSSYEMTKQRIETLIELRKKRSLFALCTKGLSMATDPTLDASDFQELLSDMDTATADDDVNEVTAAQAVKMLRHDMQERIEGRGEQGMNTGLHIFDSRWGWHTGDLIVMAGRTSQGKSTLAMTIARNMAMNGIPSVYYSLEMGAKQLTARMMARDCNLTSSRMLYDKLNDDELARFDKASGEYQQLPIYYDDKSKTSFSRICTSIRAMVRKHGIRVAYIDYLQILVNSSKTDNRESLLGDMARDLKRLAVELNICIVAISQLSRVKDKGSPEPTLSELRGSGQIEEACDMAVFVYRPYVYGIERYKDGRLTMDTAQITIAKGRNIGLAQEVVAFNGELTFFYDISNKTEQERMAEATNKPWAQADPLPF